MQSIDGNTKGTPNKKTKSPAFPEKKPQRISTNKKPRPKRRKVTRNTRLKRKPPPDIKTKPQIVHVRQELKKPKGEDQALSTDFLPYVKEA